MQYSRPMIKLLYEIRRRIHSDLKPDIKLSNPELFNQLAENFYSSNCIVIKALTREFFSLAGEPWNTLLDTPANEPSNHVVKVYRGQISLEPTFTVPETQPPESEKKSLTESALQKPVRIYRGQIIKDTP